LPLDPSSGHTTHIFTQRAGDAWEKRVTHGHGGERRQPDAMHPEKREKTPGKRKLAFSFPAFSRFDCARENRFFVPKASCAITQL